MIRDTEIWKVEDNWMIENVSSETKNIETEHLKIKESRPQNKIRKAESKIKEWRLQKTKT